MKRTLKYFTYLFIIGFLALLGVNLYITIKYTEKIQSDLTKLPQGYTALVFGASVISNRTPSSVLAERLDKALELYKNSKVTKIILSGHSSKNYNEVKVMKNYLFNRSVDKADIWLDPSGFRTLDSVHHAKNNFKIDNVILISQKYHLPRILFLADSIKLNAIGYNASLGKAEISFKNKLREYLARFLAFIEVFITKKKASTFNGKVLN